MLTTALLDMMKVWKAPNLVATKAFRTIILVAKRMWVQVRLAMKHALRHKKSEMELMKLWKWRTISKAGPSILMISERGLLEAPSSTLEAVRSVALSMMRGYWDRLLGETMTSGELNDEQYFGTGCLGMSEC